MANAKKCDRCGKFYSSKDKKFKQEKLADVLGCITLTDLSGYILKDYDLCDVCAAEFWNWLNIVKEDQSEC